MKKETGILLAGSLGVILGLGIFGIRKFLLKRHKDYEDYYADFHRHFDKKHREDGSHGVEFLAMQ
ncbi:hypothetical protein [Chryseobacterium koreense]|uniref:Uncharacterized protein n=1 Tax=Chryseobacterium koreense CCUG 49689 TaxID=1304281 RepID=A0A0J7LN20_9FLAO|nr:hypothetical protein [Chryseobacterium koreense]KMQ70485.1 hypothetical protein ACM44_11865 [Chryseobacterium koreense CCUG 49689]MBB5332291.1 hypothetical protein [Chryseobacterium koreense]